MVSGTEMSCVLPLDSSLEAIVMDDKMDSGRIVPYGGAVKRANILGPGEYQYTLNNSETCA